METISLRFDDGLAYDMEKAMKGFRYATKTEFIREAVRNKIKDLEKEAALVRLQRLMVQVQRKAERFLMKTCIKPVKKR